MTILGYNYAWDYYNQGYSAGTLSANVNFASVSGTSLHSKNWVLGPTTDWTTISGTENFANPGLLASNIANFSLSFTGKDNRFWAGYYGPMVKNPSLSLNYTFDVCSTDPLSSPSCPGYAQALLNQQCSANPLYNSSCPGYAQALLNQQCTANPLSNPQCPGYATAYLNYQCSINPLYSTTCSGYAQAYFNQQCSLNGLYDKSCPNYAEAYAKKNVLSIDTTGTSTQTQTTTTTSAVSTTAPSTTVSSDGTVSTSVSKTGDSNVDKAITPTTTTTNSSAAPAAPVQLVQPSPSSQQQSTEKKDGPSAQTASQSPQTNTQTNERGSGPGEQKTNRQELQERREAAAKKDAVEKGKNLANEMGKAANMEQQVAVQNVVLQAMGFTPGFDSYSKAIILDGPMYKPYTAYANQRNVDNARLSRGLFGATDRLHEEMTNQQYLKDSK